VTIDVDAVYEDGVLKPERRLALKEKAEVHVTIEAKSWVAQGSRESKSSVPMRSAEASPASRTKRSLQPAKRNFGPVFQKTRTAPSAASDSFR
jgi:predicted DNA-binding antitoxin AbrB/MazE fold protein